MVYTSGSRASVVFLMSPTPPTCHAWQRAAVWGFQKSPLSTSRLFRTLMSWRKHKLPRTCALRSPWQTAWRSHGRPCWSTVNFTWRFPVVFFRKDRSRALLLFWSTLKMNSAAVMSLCASRRHGPTELHWCAHSCSWDLRWWPLIIHWCPPTLISCAWHIPLTSTVGTAASLTATRDLNSKLLPGASCWFAVHSRTMHVTWKRNIHGTCYRKQFFEC